MTGEKAPAKKEGAKEGEKIQTGEGLKGPSPV